jgi:uncharacterized protein YndB with AHSA1/START domain
MFPDIDLTVKVEGRVQRPVEDVFDAVYHPQKISSYFVTAGASAPLDEGKTVTWEFADFPGPFPVEVKQCIPQEKIVFEWEASHKLENGQPYNTTVTFEFKKIADDNTLVTITESGWEKSAQGFLTSRGNTGGWMNMLTCMKAYVEHGINLREGMFK